MYSVCIGCHSPSKRALKSGRAAYLVRLRLALLLGLASMIPLDAFASDEWSIAEVYSTLDQHPSVLAMEQQVEAISELRKTSGSLPDPSVIAGIDNLPLDNFSFNDYLPTSKVLGIRQAFPKRGETEVMSERYTADLKLKQLLVDRQRAALRADYRAASIRAWLAQAQSESLSSSLATLTELSEQYEVQAAQGDAIDAHILHIKRERIVLNRALKKQALHEEQAKLKIHSLLNAVQVLNYEQIARSIGDFDRLVGADLFDIEQARLEIAQAQSALSKAELEFDPSFAVQALYKQRESGRNFDGDDWLSVQASVSIPLWSSSRQVPQANAAKRERQSAARRLDAERLVWQERVQSAQEESRWLQEELDLIVSQKALMDEQASAQERLYESLESDWVSVLELRLRSQSLQREYFEVEARRLQHINEFKRHVMAFEGTRKGG